jgi:hypothetical protein
MLRAFVFVLLALPLLLGCNERVSKLRSRAAHPVPSSERRFSDDDKNPIHFADVKADIFDLACTDCHNPTDHKGHLDLTDHGTAMAAVCKNGQKCIVPGHPEESRLVKVLENQIMPPGDRLPDEDLRRISDWIKKGARP